MESKLEGVNEGLYQWALGSADIGKFLKNEEVPNKILKDIFSNNADEREIASISFYNDVWKYYPELGPNPMIGVLANFEHDRVFYKDYRNHTTHIVKTFFLGLYIYDKVKYIHEKIDAFFMKNKNGGSFVKTWAIAALYHDIGYVLENSKIGQYKDEWDEFKNHINESLGYPLTFVLASKGITREKERSFIKSNEIYMNSIDSIGELDADNEENRTIWDVLIEGGHQSGLCTDKNLNGVKEYYNFVMKKTTVDDREGYMDHGICSALILEKVWYGYYDYVKKIVDKGINVQKLSPVTKTDISKLLEKIKDTEKLICIAANAIALHNIDIEQWRIEDAAAYNLCLNDFRLDFVKMPVACLLRFCDELQLWDREKYRRPLPEDKSFKGKDVSIIANEEAVYLKIKSDDRYTHPEKDPDSEYNRICKKIKKYFDNKEVNKILRCGIPEQIETAAETEVKDTKNDDLIDDVTITAIKAAETADAPERWLVGAVNLDEDVHFSSLYLRQSMSENLPDDLKQFGYKNLVAVYEDYNETYYIPQNECIEAAERLIKYSLDNFDFWEKTLDEISRRIDDLNSVFKNLRKQSAFHDMSEAELLSYYEAHYTVHSRLYEYARIPEALDRGMPTFTAYLKKYLSSKAAELKEEKKLNEVFGILTYPENISYSGENILEICDIISAINETSTKEELEDWKVSGRRFLIGMNPRVAEKIEEYTNKWTFWGYHGYRNRVLRDFSYFAENLRIELTNKELKEQESILLKRQREASSKRIRTFSKYNIHEKYQNLFRAYSQIGTIKLKRRYYQLVNFYYLDQMIYEIAKRNNVKESIIRCMLPEEVMELLKGNKSMLERGIERADSKLFVYRLKGNMEEIICGTEAERIVQEIRKSSAHIEKERGKMIGETASLGYCQGICRVLDQDNANYFEEGEILVATDIDPDKFHLLKLAKAVVTETGGFTSHAAIVCRELQIPCIVGIHELTKTVKTGEYLEVNANCGSIRVITPIQEEIIRYTDENSDHISKEEIGAKAFSLICMKKAGFLVPDFFCVRIESLRAVTDNDTAYTEQRKHSLIIDIQKTINKYDNEWWAIRSSTNREDGDEFSGAGQEITMLRVHKTDVIRDLFQMAGGMKEYSGEGCFIIQKMILGSYSGVIFTDNPLGNPHELIIQAVPGGCEYLTSGKTNPVTYIYRKDLLEFEETDNCIWKNLLSPKIKKELQVKAMQVAEYFKNPQDLEWTIQGDRIYFLQSRNITGKKKIDPDNIFSTKNSMTVNTLSIYQAYALPIHLRDHLLRTTAVVCWILDHWKGEPLNETVMIKASLLHDIGNIVKGTDEKFSHIFPDFFSEDSWPYWLNIRKHIGDRYGKSDIDATLNIAKEINVGEEVLELIKKKQFCNNESTYNENDFQVKICAYADQRVSPSGILSLNGRLDEAKIRYRGVENSSVNNPNYQNLKEYAEKIERQIFSKVNGHPEDITDKAVECYINILKGYEF